MPISPTMRPSVLCAVRVTTTMHAAYAAPRHTRNQNSGMDLASHGSGANSETGATHSSSRREGHAGCDDSGQTIYRHDVAVLIPALPQRWPRLSEICA